MLLRSVRDWPEGGARPIPELAGKIVAKVEAVDKNSYPAIVVTFTDGATLTVEEAGQAGWITAEVIDPNT